MVEWLKEATNDAAGLVVPLSGTDSALAFLLAVQAKPGRVVAVHYGENYPFRDWFAQFGEVEVVKLPEYPFLDIDDYRWAAIQTYARTRGYWIVGTRNRNEELTNDYSQASRVAVIQPLLRFWKSEVLLLCRHLGVPNDLLAAGWMGDPHCECHRPEVMRNLPVFELVLAVREGEVSEAEARQNPLYHGAVQRLEVILRKRIPKDRLPYCPPIPILAAAIEP